jgi:RNA polymerase sigma-54 factor
MESRRISSIQKLQQSLKLEQKMSPLQVLMIRVTQCPRLELKNIIYQEIEANPMLSLAEEDESSEPSESLESTSFQEEEKEKEEDLLNKELKDFFTEDFPTYFVPTDLEEVERKQIPYTSTLSEQLKTELRMELSDEKLIEVGEYMIDSLTDEGFLDTPLPTIAEFFCILEDKIEATLKIIQECAPPGIAARSVRESIKIHLERAPEKSKLELKIVNDFWEDYKRKEIGKISYELNIAPEKIKKAIENIQKINPRPTGRDFGRVEYITPSVIVEKNGEELKISINEPELPFFRINTSYLKVLQAPKNYDKKTVKFVEKWMERAKFILQSLEMRKKNFKKVMEYIINFQKDFFDKGVMHMNPLTLKKIARTTNLSESTISRYIKDTYVQSPKGVFHIKHLLSGGVKGREQNISTNTIREKIRRMIEAEGSEKLSDIEIKKELEKEGINITRRTVAKYRNQMGILPKAERKKENLF